MTWQKVIKARPFLTEDEEKFASKAVAAQMASVPMDIEDSIKSKKQLTRLINKVKRYEGEEFEEKFQQVNWEKEDREGILQILTDARDGLSQPTKDNQPHIADKIQAFLDGNHEALLELVERSKMKGLASAIQQWNRKNGDELREYLRDNPDLAEKFKKVFKRLESVEDKKKEVSEESLSDDLVHDYVQMIVSDLKIPSMGSEMQLGKSSYLPILDGKKKKPSMKFFGIHPNQSGNLPPATSYILNNTDINFEQFLAVADTKTSTKKEIILNRLRSNKVGGELQDAWDAKETLSGFENTVAANSDLSNEFKRLMEGLGGEMQVKDITTEVKYSIPKEAYEKMMQGVFDETLRPYGITSEYALDEMMDEHREDLAGFREKVSGFFRPIDKKAKERIEQSEVLREEGIELWDGSTGQLKELSSSMVSGKAFPQYLQTLSEIENKNKIIIDAAEGNKNQVMLGDFILYLIRAEMTYVSTGKSEIKTILQKYSQEPTEENSKAVEETLNRRYSIVREDTISAIRKKISSLLKDYNSNYLHGKGSIEPLEWLWERT